MRDSFSYAHCMFLPQSSEMGVILPILQNKALHRVTQLVRHGPEISNHATKSHIPYHCARQASLSKLAKLNWNI
jgi:hypothetical protein